MRLIDAEELKKKIYDEFEAFEELTFTDFIRHLDDAPTLNDKCYAIGYANGSREGYKKGIEDARPTGKWERDDNGFTCTHCKMHYKNIDTVMGKPMWEYCPECGEKKEV